MVLQCALRETTALVLLKTQLFSGSSSVKAVLLMCWYLSVFGFCAGMIGGNAPRPAMASGDWGSQAPAVRVTCAPTAGTMNRPVQAGMIRNPTASIPLRPSSQPGPRQMLPSQVMNMGKFLLVHAGLLKIKQEAKKKVQNPRFIYRLDKNHISQ